MYIIGEKSKNETCIHGFSPIPDKISEFKKAEMANFPLEFFCAKKDRCTFLSDPECFSDDLNHREHAIPNGCLWSHILIPQTEESVIKQCLEDYYNGKLIEFNPCIVYEGNRMDELKRIKYFLLAQKYDFRGIIDKILSVPESLYLLQLLEQANFTGIDFDRFDVSSLLALFDIDREPRFIVHNDELYFDKRYAFKEKYGFDPYDQYDKGKNIMSDARTEATQKLLKVLK